MSIKSQKKSPLKQATPSPLGADEQKARGAKGHPKLALSHRQWTWPMQVWSSGEEAACPHCCPCIRTLELAHQPPAPSQIPVESLCAQPCKRDLLGSQRLGLPEGLERVGKQGWRQGLKLETLAPDAGAAHVQMRNHTDAPSFLFFSMYFLSPLSFGSHSQISAHSPSTY